MSSAATLYYVHDPMCSWCYAFRPGWTQIQDQLPDHVRVQYVLGGLAPDTDQPMPQEMRTTIQDTWRKITQRVPGTPFNFAFWDQCQPRRATYPACRAVLVARQVDARFEIPMINAIQNAYYQQARNPSDNTTLYALAQEIGLDQEAFSRALNADTTQQALLAEIRFARQIGGDRFPSLFLQQHAHLQAIPVNYNDASQVMRYIAGFIR